MGRFREVALLLLVQLVAYSYGQFNIPRSSSGRPFGFDLSRNTEIFPDYNSRFGTVGFGIEHRPSSNLDIIARPGIHHSDLLAGRFRPQGNVELRYRPNPNTRFNAGAGVDASGRPRGSFGLTYQPSANTRLNLGGSFGTNGERRANIGFTHRFGRSVKIEAARNDAISRKLFAILDLNNDGQLDVKEWFDENGKVPSFANMLDRHDTNADEMISLEEFVLIPVDPNIDIDISQLKTTTTTTTTTSDQDQVQ